MTPDKDLALEKCIDFANRNHGYLWYKPFDDREVYAAIGVHWEYNMEIIDIQSISKRCEKATQGPWISYIEGRDFSSGCSFIKTTGEDIELSGATDDDQDFIASCRQDIPLLIAEIERLRKILDENGIDYTYPIKYEN